MTTLKPTRIERTRDGLATCLSPDAVTLAVALAAALRAASVSAVTRLGFSAVAAAAACAARRAAAMKFDWPPPSVAGAASLPSPASDAASARLRVPPGSSGKSGGRFGSIGMRCAVCCQSGCGCGFLAEGHGRGRRGRNPHVAHLRQEPGSTIPGGSQRRERKTRQARCGGSGGGLRAAQVAFDRRQAVDDMAQRGMQRFQRILRPPFGRRLAVADVGQFALDRIDELERRRSAPPLGGGETARADARAGAARRTGLPRSGRNCCATTAANLRGVRADRRCAVRHGPSRPSCHRRPTGGRCVRTARWMAPSRCSEVGSRCHRAAFHGRRQQRDALFERGQHVAAAGLRQMIDLLAERADVVGSCGRSRRWMRRWRRCCAARRSRLRAAGRCWNPDWREPAGRSCSTGSGSRCRSPSVARPASARARRRRFRSARARCRQAFPDRRRFRGCVRSSGRACGFRSRASRLPDAATLRSASGGFPPVPRETR